MPADLLRRAAAELREAAAKATPGPWRTHDTYLPLGGHTATVLTARQDLNASELVAWLPTMSNEPWTDGRNAWNNAAWIALMHPGVAEPLAALLEAIADQITPEGIHHDNWRSRGCGRPVSPYGSIVLPTSCVCPAVRYAVDTARTILGEVADV